MMRAVRTLALALLPVCRAADTSKGRFYPETHPYPTPDQEPTGPTCKDGEVFLVDNSSFLENETWAVDRFIMGWGEDLAKDTIRQTTVACLAGELVVPSDLAPEYAKGLFAKGGSYTVLVRVNSKGAGAMRMSVKVFGLESMDMLDAVGPNDAERGTFDMIFEPLGSPSEMDSAKLAAANQRSHANGMALVTALLSKKGISSRRLAEEMRADDPAEGTAEALAEAGRRLAAVDWEMNMGTRAATRWGSKSEPAAKLFWKHAPVSMDCHDAEACKAAVKPALEKLLQAGAIELPLHANLQTCGDDLEKTSEAWSTTKIAQVATLRLFHSQKTTTCDKIAYTPWHAPKAHKPVGNMQRARKDSYYAGAVKRGAVPAVKPMLGRLYPVANPYPTPDQAPTGDTCKDGEVFLKNDTSFLKNETWAVDRFIMGWGESLALDTIRQTTVACLAGQLQVPSGTAAEFAKGLFAKEGSYTVLTRVNSKGADAMRMSVKVFGLESMDMLDPVGPNDVERGTMDMIFEPIAEAGTTSLPDLAKANQRSHANGMALVTALLGKKGITSRRLTEEMRADDPRDPEVGAAGSDESGSAHTARAAQTRGGRRLAAKDWNMNMGTAVATRWGSKSEPAAKLFWKHAPVSMDCHDTEACKAAVKPALEKLLEKGAIEIPIYANLQTCGDDLEKTSVAWSTTKIAQVATLKLSQSQDVSTCDKIAYTPWHGLKAHKPVGNMQRARKDSYYAGAVKRGAMAAVKPALKAAATSPTTTSAAFPPSAPSLLAAVIAAAAFWQ